MDSNDSPAAEAQVRIPCQVIDGEAEGADWRSRLQQDSRQGNANKIMEILKRRTQFSGQEGLRELKKIADRLEEKIYTAATSESDYLRQISLRLLTRETKSENPMANSLQSNAASNSRNHQVPAFQSMQSQTQKQVQQSSIATVSNQSQVLLSQNLPGLTPAMLQQQTTIDQQKQLLQSQSGMPEVPLTSLDSSSQVGSAAWQAEILEKLKYSSPEQLFMSYQQQLIEQQQQLIEQQRRLKLQQCLLRHIYRQRKSKFRASSSLKFARDIFIVFLNRFISILVETISIIVWTRFSVTQQIEIIPNICVGEA